MFPQRAWLISTAQKYVNFKGGLKNVINFMNIKKCKVR
jgi:hypothetical protein